MGAGVFHELRLARQHTCDGVGTVLQIASLRVAWIHRLFSFLAVRQHHQKVKPDRVLVGVEVARVGGREVVGQPPLGLDRLGHLLGQDDLRMVPVG